MLQGLKVPAYSPVAPPGQRRLKSPSDCPLPLRGKATLPVALPEHRELNCPENGIRSGRTTLRTSTFGRSESGEANVFVQDFHVAKPGLPQQIQLEEQ